MIDTCDHTLFLCTSGVGVVLHLTSISLLFSLCLLVYLAHGLSLFRLLMEALLGFCSAWGDPSSPSTNKDPLSESSHRGLPLKLLLPAILGPVGLLSCCVICCICRYHKWASRKYMDRYGTYAKMDLWWVYKEHAKIGLGHRRHTKMGFLWVYLGH